MNLKLLNNYVSLIHVLVKLVKSRVMLEYGLLSTRDSTVHQPLGNKICNLGHCRKKLTSNVMSMFFFYNLSLYFHPVLSNVLLVGDSAPLILTVYNPLVGYYCCQIYTPTACPSSRVSCSYSLDHNILFLVS